MTELLSPAGQQALRNFITPSTLFAFDLDGTLAPIVDDPTAARTPSEVRDGLRKLAQLAVTAVITGRSCSDALPRLGFQPQYLVGNHGNEGLPGSDDQASSLAELILHWQQQLQHQMSPESWGALYVEQKSSSLSLHYRHALQREEVHAQLLAAIDRLTPTPRRVGGKFVENLLPPEAPHKGDALLRLMEHSGCPNALFVGDDETDEDVFRLRDRRIFSICVGTQRPTAAAYYLHDQNAMPHALELMIALLRSN
ncbi:MAG: trehalose-phosphatase [Candidatus Cloacimonetes bacterium]|nr:trehalose-phosphatase [Candidatus Cloacimonadota bacterium]